MQPTFETLVKLYVTPGRKDKGNLITANKDNEKLLTFLSLSMDDYNTYGISETSFATILKPTEFFYKPEQLSEMFEVNTESYSSDKYDTFVNTLIPYLLSQQSPSNEVLDKVGKFFTGLNPVERYFYYRVIIKNLNIGIGPKTINQALKRILIKQYTPMLADSGMEKFDKWKFGDKTPEYLVDTKINGLRLTLFITKDDIVIKTRSGRRFNYLEDYFKKNWLSKEEVKKNVKDSMDYQNTLAETIQPTPSKFTDTLVIDCELQHKDKTWESSISIINVNEVEVYPCSMDTEPLFYLHCFDIVNEIPFLPENFNVETITLNNKIRRQALETFVKSLHPCLASALFKLSDCSSVAELSEVEVLAKKYIEAKYEGAVVKHPDGMYVCDRGTNWLKIKDIQTYDGKIVEILPGDKSGKYSNVVGKLIVKVTIDGKEMSGSIGTGFKEADREMLMKEKDKMIGKTVEFTILSKTVKDNFQSGVFKCLRTDV